jgi:hypothetical protein
MAHVLFSVLHCFARAHKTRADTAAHPLLHGNLAWDSMGRTKFSYGFQHRSRTAGQYGVITALAEQLSERQRDRTLNAEAAVVRSDNDFLAYIFKVFPKNRAAAVSEAKKRSDVPGTGTRSIKHRRHADPAADEDDVFAIKLKAPAKWTKYVQQITSAAFKKPTRSVSARFNDDSQDSVPTIADADRASEETGFAAPDVDKLPRRSVLDQVVCHDFNRASIVCQFRVTDDRQ